MDSAQADLFFAQGYLHLEHVLPKNRMASLRQKVLDELKRQKAWDGKHLSNSLKGVPLFQQIGKLSSLVKVQGLHDALMTPELIGCITRLAGGVPPAIQGTQLLLSPPHQGNWTLEGLNWHVDVAAEPDDPLPGIQAFFLLDDLAPRGGATVALAGSHRISSRRSASVSPLREVLATATDLERKLRELDITVVEMSGRAGDVFLMDMRTLHAPSINSTKKLRMMATARCFLSA